MRASSASDRRQRLGQHDGKKKAKPPQLHDGPMELSPGLLLVEDAPESHLVSVKNLQFFQVFSSIVIQAVLLICGKRIKPRIELSQPCPWYCALPHRTTP